MSNKKHSRTDEQSHGNNSHKGGNGNSQSTPGLARGQEEQLTGHQTGNSSEGTKGTNGNERQGGTGGAIRSGR